VLRNLVSRMMVVFRLAVVVSLAGYTIPNANAAMHGSAYADVAVSIAVEDHEDARFQAVPIQHADAGHHAHGDHNGDGDDFGKQVKKDCCQDFCFSAALPSSVQSSGVVTASSPLHFLDDGRIQGTRPSLHRPPNIRA